MKINKPKPASRFELQGCIYNFETPNSKIKINIFQSAVGNKIPNGLEFLEFLRPIRELLKTEQIKDIRQLIQRELDDQRIINSLVPYLLNNSNREVAFFPSVLGVLMPKDYLNNLGGLYPTKVKTKDDADEITYEFSKENTFNWSVTLYKTPTSEILPFSALTVDKDTCDIVIVDGQHRTNAFRAINNKLTADNVVIREIYKNIDILPPDSDVSLPLTLLWFENSDSQTISPEIISRKLFIDVNNSAKSIATSRKILLDDRNPLHLLTNHFYSVIAKDYNFSLDELSLAHLGCDVPNEVSQQSTFDSMPFSYLTTPERVKNIFDVFFMRKKGYEINASVTRSPQARKAKYSLSKLENEQSAAIDQLVNFFTKSIRHECIVKRYDEYMEAYYVYVGEDLTSQNESKQDIVRQEFENLYFKSFYQLFSEFNIFKNYRENIVNFDKNYINNPATLLTTKESWKSSFLLGQSIYFTLRKSSSNTYSQAIDIIETEFRRQYLKDTFIDFNDNITDKKDLLLLFRTLAFQIGYFEAFYQYCIYVKEIDFTTTNSNDLLLACNDFLKEVNNIKNGEWVNCFEFARDLQGEMHPKIFPVITHYILRRIQNTGQFFNKIDNWYFSPECVHFYEKSKEKLIVLFRENFNPPERKEFKQKSIDEILSMKAQGKEISEHLDNIFQVNLDRTNNIFKNYLGISVTYLDEADKLKLLKDDIIDNIIKTIPLN
jgi:hypothetical protein